MGMISRLWSNRLISPLLMAMEGAKIRLRETLVYSIDVRSAGHAKAETKENVEFSITTKPLPDWPDVVAASSQAPKPGEKEDIWINAMMDGQVVGTLAVCFRPYFVEEACMLARFPGGYIFGYYVLEDKRGRGIGKAMIHEAIDLVASEGQVDWLFAFVDSKNLASKRTFDATGFKVEKRISSFIMADRGFHKTFDV